MVQRCHNQALSDFLVILYIIGSDFSTPTCGQPGIGQSILICAIFNL
ncbi:MAG: hypothetical protein OP8BY_0930 [Candidatus Saccharicenans subterraneus]|uniref:Uncharacterized protein n=1 Tax=Candidatus Saccharicenans subterraneus TaxID=2508984 RepID=A0A3E2BQI6_9BACT|nr:MAG: hypothetical protein OP8BY_0930 [Candidatus Saccharicenans subterraneum]